MDDELDARRNKNSVDEGTEGAKEAARLAMKASEQALNAIMAQKSITDMRDWRRDNMPNEHLSCHANEMESTIMGCLIGTWFDTGAAPDLIKEYLSKYVDMIATQYEAARDLNDGG